MTETTRTRTDTSTEAKPRGRSRRLLRRTSLIVCVGAVLGVFTLAGSVMGDNADDLERLRAETARLVGFYDALKPGERYDREAFAKKVRPVDALARTIVTNLFKKHRDFDAVVKASEGVIQWREWPRNATHDAIISFFYEGRKEKSLQINYRTWTGPDGKVLYVFQNTFRNRPPAGHRSYDRISPTMWLVVINGGKVTTTRLPYLLVSRMTNPVWVHGGRTPSVLGFTDEGTALPGILVLSGPDGKGRYSSIHLYAQDGSDGSWHARYVGGRDAYHSLSYDENTRELRGTVVVGPSQLHRKERPMRVICDRSGPLVMDLSTVPGANYTVKEAPLLITVTNTSNKPIRIKVRFSDERIFRTDQFYLNIKGMDWKDVQYGPRHHEAPLPKDEKTYQEIGPKEKLKIKVDIAKFQKNLKEGEFLLTVYWQNTWDENSFGGQMRSPTIKLTLKPAERNAK